MSFDCWNNAGNRFEAGVRVAGGVAGDFSVFLCGSGRCSSPVPGVANNIVVGSASPSRVIVILAKV